MLYYVVKGRGRSAINLLLVGWGRGLADRLRVLDYDWLLRQRRLPLGSYIFTGIDVLSVAERERLAIAWSALSQADAGIKLLNHPLQVMLRYELLRTLYEAGINPFNVYRLTEARMPARYPVFLRYMDDHEGPRSELLADANALRSAVGDLVARGESRERWQVSEFADTRTEDGVYRKYAAFYLRHVDGGVVIPRHVQSGTDWMVKGTTREHAAANLAIERDYVASNPHAAQIRRIFDLARIDFGRIDYAVARDGSLVVFEINTNPQLVTPGPALGQGRDELKRTFAQRFVAALEALDAPVPAGATVPVRFDPRPLWRRKPFAAEIVMAAMARLRLQRYQPAVYAGLMRLRRRLGGVGR